jgi:hypothetical protein
MGICVENYIVRIYRRETDDPNGVIGTVECVETRTNKPFHGLRRLGDLLATRGMAEAPDTDAAGETPLPRR